MIKIERRAFFKEKRLFASRQTVIPLYDCKLKTISGIR